MSKSIRSKGDRPGLFRYLFTTFIQVIKAVAILALILAVMLFIADFLFVSNSRSTPSDNSTYPPGFSVWDGSNQDLVKHVITIMSDPESFTHVETDVLQTKDENYLIVNMKWRGKNAFNATVTHETMAIVEKNNGKVKEIIETQ